MKNKEPKFGLIVFKNTDNIGDDVQSYAASRFLPKIDYIIDREEVDSFVSNEKEIVNCIMNAWWLSKRSNFPPTPYINPLPVSMHLRNTEVNGPTYLKGLSMKWLKSHEPIGLRDNLVKKYLDEAGVDNYFSGCMTLTIEKEKNVKKEDYICVVDLDKEIVDIIKNNTDLKVVEVCHDVDSNVSAKLNWKDREKNVKKLLRKYQKARCVITSRLHSCLPCLAIEEPVLLIYDSNNQDVVNRMSLYSKMCNSIIKKDCLKDYKKLLEYINNPLPNPKEYLKYRNSLIKKCQEFIKNAKYEKVDDEEYVSYKEERFKDLKEQAESLYFQVEELQYQRDYYKDKYEEINLLCDKYKNESKQLSESLSRLYNSKRYRYVENIRKILGMNKNDRNNS